MNSQKSIEHSTPNNQPPMASIRGIYSMLDIRCWLLDVPRFIGRVRVRGGRGKLIQKISPLFPLRFITCSLLCLAALATATIANGQQQTSFKFTFAGPASHGIISVSPSDLYANSAVYGFEPGAAVAAGHGCITSTNPFYFSVKLPEGNYLVTVTLGDKAAASTTTVKAELRRLALYHVQTAPGKFVTRKFIVNLRRPEIAGDGVVHLKPREKAEEWWDWDDKLTLEFNDAHPCLRALTIAPAEVPTVYLLGDSTVCDQPSEPWNSWGQMLPVFFKPQVAIANHSESGETVAGSLAGNRFKKVFSLMKPGDYLFIHGGRRTRH